MIKHYFCGVILMLFLAACNTNDTSKFQHELAVKTDTLELDNRNDTLLLGSQGTAIFFEKESFVLPDGSLPKGKVTIQLKECYRLSDMIRENLSTTSGANILETRGMIYINAFADNQQLQLNAGKKYILHFPKDSTDRQKQMNLFYGEVKDDKVNWALDSTTLLKPTAFMSGWMTTGYSGGDTSREVGFYFKGERESNIYEYFYKHFDNSRLRQANYISDKRFRANFIVTRHGKISNLNIVEERLDSSRGFVDIKTKVDPYFYQYIQQIPALEPFYSFNEDNKLVPFDANSAFYIDMGLFPPGYRNNETYNKLFNEKYAAFKNAAVHTMNDAELNYFVFSASKLGWINCDYFWKTNDEKIDYIVKVDPDTKPSIRLIFKQAKSIMNGTLEGDKCIFSGVPVNQQVRIVSVLYQNNHPQLAIKETSITKEKPGELEYKDFSITELEKQLNIP